MATLLLTNDDGIHSQLLLQLAAALRLVGHTVYVVAPATDHSWVGASMTTGRPLTATHLSADVWSVDGTPADCVGIALGGLITAPIHAVVSGINLGVNTRLPMVLASGTVGAATVGAMLGRRAIAFSFAMPATLSASAKAAGGILPETADTTAAMVAHCVTRVSQLLSQPLVPGRVINVNFPSTVTAATSWVVAPMAVTTPASYFAVQPDGTWRHYPKLGASQEGVTTEFSVLGQGHIAESIIDWPLIGA